MRLEKIVLQGFKSFNGESVVSFPSPVTAIVGPNGSGKSNIVEAFRFALGEQSTKFLRGKIGKDLIFSGDTRAKKASVTIHFNNSDGFFPLPFKKITIGRSVFSTGINEYTINGSIVRLKDVQELLSAMCITSKGHSIISQGEADKVLNATPKELKNIIEEGLGLSIFRLKKRETLVRLEKTRENLKEVSIAKREIHPRFLFLEKQMKTIEESKKMRHSLNTLYKEYMENEKKFLTILQEEYIHDKKERETIEKENDTPVLEKENDHPHLKEIQVCERDMGNIRKALRKNTHLQGVLEGKMSLNNTKEYSIKRNDVKSIYEMSKNEYERVEKETNIGIILSSFQKTVTAFGSILKKETQEIDMSHLEKEKKALQEEYTRLSQQEHEIEKKIHSLHSVLNEIVAKEKQKMNAFYERKQKINTLEMSLSQKKERYDSHQEDFQREMQEARVLLGSTLDIQEKKEAVWSKEVRNTKRRELERLKIRIEETSIGGQGEISQEYETTKKRIEHLEKETQDVEKSIETLEEGIHSLDSEIEKRFKEGVGTINTLFNSFFRELFTTGNASLKVVPVEKEEKGIEIATFLPHKKVNDLNQLSGGERSLISIAFLFALSQASPPPFLILDETDAALDEANSRRYGSMISLLAKKSQLILITHNRETMGRADIIYGVTMNKTGESKLLSINFEQAEKTVT